MEPSVQNVIEVSAIVTAIMGGLLKLAEKFILPMFMALFKGNKGEDTINDRVLKIETNHLVHIEQDIREIREEQVQQGNRITRLETLLDKKK